jgi:hypothetical protein
MDKKLKALLKKEKLERLLPLFANQGITDSILGDLSDGDLRDLGIDKLGERKRLFSAFSGIGRGAFSGCCNLTNVTIPDSVNEVYHPAFEKCPAGQTAYEVWLKRKNRPAIFKWFT